MLLKEEMQHTLKFLKWRSANWLDKASQSALKKPLPSPQVLEGLTAYAFQQADIFISLHDHFLSLWHSFTAVDGSLDHPPLISMEIKDISLFCYLQIRTVSLEPDNVYVIFMIPCLCKYKDMSKPKMGCLT